MSESLPAEKTASGAVSLPADPLALAPGTAELLTPITRQLRKNLAAASSQLFEAGCLLLEAKDLLGHGRFQAWLKKNFNMSGKTANRLMSIARMVIKLELDSDMIEKLLYLDLSLIYELAAKSTPEAVQRQFFQDISDNRSVNHEKLMLLKHNSGKKPESQVLSKSEFTQFLRVLKQFSNWFDHHQNELRAPHQQLHIELKSQLALYAQQLKAASEVVNEILEQKDAIPLKIITGESTHETLLLGR